MAIGLMIRSYLSRATESGRKLWESAAAKYDELAVIIKADRKGWLVCLAVLVITVVRSGITYSFGMFVVELKREFPDLSISEQNWIGTLSFCISLSCAPLSVSFIRWFGHRGFRVSGLLGTVILTVSCLGSSFVRTPEWLFVTHSLMYGVGSSLIYMASSLVIGDYFTKDHKYHVLATSILLCGYPVGSLLFNPINAWLLANFNFRIAFRCAAAIVLGTGVACCWNFSARDVPSAQQLQEEYGADGDDEMDAASIQSCDGREGSGGDGKIRRRCCTWAEVRQRPEIVLWYLGNCLSYLGFYMPFVNLGYYMERKHFALQESSVALTLLSTAECVTYVIASFLGDYLKDRLVYVNVVSSGCLAVICIVWPLIDITYTMILAVAIGMGGFLGLNIVYTYAASGEVTQLPIDVAWACTNLWSGIGILLGPFFSGVVFDINQSYTDVFLVVGGVYFADMLIFAAIPLLQYRRYGTGTATGASCDELNGATKFETFHISTCKRSASKSSLANGGGADPVTGSGSYGYASTVGNDSSTAALMSAYGAITSKAAAAVGRGGGVGGNMATVDMNGTGMTAAAAGSRSVVPPPSMYAGSNYD